MKKELIVFLFIIQNISFPQSGWYLQANLPVLWLDDVCMINLNNGITAGGGKLFRTINGGSAWQQQSLGFQPQIKGLFFLDENNGYAVGGVYNQTNNKQETVIIKTTDGGENWVRQTYSNSFWLNSIFFLTPSDGWAVGDSGLIIHTANGGQNWQNQSSGTLKELQDLYFIDSNNGFCVGWGGTILKTSDGGSTWSSINSPWVDYNSISFADSLNGFIVGTGGRILLTTDGGLNWIVNIIGGSNYNFLDVDFINLLTAVAVGYINDIWTPIIYKTTNGGDTWNQQFASTTAHLHAISFSDSITGTVVGHNGTILRTTDGGITFVDDKNTQFLYEECNLLQNYPNPFNPNTKISWQSPLSGWQTIKVFDVLGREVASLLDEFGNAGNYEVEFNASNLPSGVYFYQLKAGNYLATKKMILLK